MGPSFVTGVSKMMVRRRSVWLSVSVCCGIVTFLMAGLLINKSPTFEDPSGSRWIADGFKYRRFATVNFNKDGMTKKNITFKSSPWNLSLTSAKHTYLLKKDSAETYPYAIQLGPGLKTQEPPNYTSELLDKNIRFQSKAMGGALHLMVLGDWGGSTWRPYTTQIQLAVARAMEEVAISTPVHGVISVGDNFYEVGVTDLNDPHFNATFEQVYRGHLLHKPWFIQAGNHDNYGNLSAQIYYASHSERWIFPSCNYQVSWNLTGPSRGGKVTIIMVDTIMLCGNSGVVYPLDPPMGPSDPELAEETWAWLENTLREASNADHLVVVGHFPVMSVGLHGPTECLQEHMLPMLHKYSVSAYVTGHDHNMQHILIPSVKHKWDVNHYVVGTGAKVEPIVWHMGDVPSEQLLFYKAEMDPEQGAGGFALMELDSTWMNFTFYNSNTQPLHRHSILSRLHQRRKSAS